MFFSRAENKLIKNTNNLSFRIYCTDNNILPGKGHPSPPFPHCVRGSITVEACLICPVFLLAVLSLLFMMPLMKNQEEIQVAVLETGKWASSLDYFCTEMGVRNSLTETVAVQEKIKKEISETGFWENCLAGGKEGLSGICLTEEDKLRLIVYHAVDLPVYVRTLYLRIGAQQALGRGFIGDAVFPEGVGGDGIQNGQDEADQIVYVAENGQVFHRSRECTHLTLSVMSGTAGQMGQLRNRYGAKYYACERCKGEETLLFYTSDGTRYHNDRNCSGLKRTIFEYPLSETGGLRCCSRCGG